STASKRKAQRISTVITHPVHWVNAVAQRLRHLTAMLITHQTVQIEIPERNLWAAFCPLPQQLWGLSSSESSEHHHARYPEEDNVVGGNQNVSWVELLSIWSLLWPPEGRKWPQCRREPCIEYVWILLVAFRCGFIWA